MCAVSSREYLIDLVGDHCLAFSDHIQPLKSRQYASEFPGKLIKDLVSLNNEIKIKLDSLKVDPDFLLLNDSVAHRIINRYLILYNYLCNSVSFIEKSDVPHTIVELVQPIKRLMNLHTDVKEFELLLYPFPIVNYTFLNLGSDLTDVKKELGIPNNKVIFSRQLITIGFPGLELGQTLSHSIIAHELGHCLYMQHNLNKKLLPVVKLSKSEVNKIFQSVSSGRPSIDEISGITKAINTINEKWVKELTCDAIGYSLFGPAFLFAAIELLPIMHPSFDYDVGTHPTTRMRLLLLYKMFEEESEFIKIINPKVKSHLDKWRKITRSQRPRFSLLITVLAGPAIIKIYDNIIKEAKAAVIESKIYSASRHSEEIKELVKRAKNFVLPNEYIKNGKSKVVAMQSIFNAGWLVYYSELDKLQAKFGLDSWTCKRKFNEIIARAIELNEIQKRWKEVS